MTRIREFAAFNNVRRHGGQPWRFSTHQFRKTFARFIARRDRSQLLALADHLKHVSVAMTARGYVGTDFDLHQLVDHEGQIETATARDRLLTADPLAGKMGERIAAGNASFRGRAGEQVRRDYIKFVLKETDLTIHACEYGWCVFQAETSRCGGRLRARSGGAQSRGLPRLRQLRGRTETRAVLARASRAQPRGYIPCLASNSCGVG